MISLTRYSVVEKSTVLTQFQETFPGSLVVGCASIILHLTSYKYLAQNHISSPASQKMTSDLCPYGPSFRLKWSFEKTSHKVQHWSPHSFWRFSVSPQQYHLNWMSLENQTTTAISKAFGYFASCLPQQRKQCQSNRKALDASPFWHMSWMAFALSSQSLGWEGMKFLKRKKSFILLMEEILHQRWAVYPFKIQRSFYIPGFFDCRISSINSAFKLHSFPFFVGWWNVW